jgi:hypothetical protein
MYLSVFYSNLWVSSVGGHIQFLAVHTEFVKEMVRCTSFSEVLASPGRQSTDDSYLSSTVQSHFLIRHLSKICNRYSGTTI